MPQHPQIETTLKQSVGQAFRCPDSHVRTLKAFECVDELVHVQMSGGTFFECPVADFQAYWAEFHPNPGTEVATVPKTELATVSMTPQVAAAARQADQIIDTTEIVKMMQDQMRKIASGNPAAINQGHAMAGLAKQVLEAGKLKLNLMRTVHQFNQPANA